MPRLARAVQALLVLHQSDGRDRCAECSRGPWLVDWPCRTYRTLLTTLRQAGPAPADLDPDALAVFTWAILALHHVFPAVGRQPARCRCGATPTRCPVWTLAGAVLRVRPGDGDE